MKLTITFKRMLIIRAFMKFDKEIYDHWITEFWVLDQMLGYGLIANTKILHEKND